MEELLQPASLIALGTLAVLEIVLGIDNIVFLAILTGKLPPHQQKRARTLGLMLAAGGRVALLLAISWVITLDKTVLFTLPFAMGGDHHAAEHPPVADKGAAADEGVGEEGSAEGAKQHAPDTTPISAKDLVLLLGGLFLIGKATWEISHQLDQAHETGPKRAFANLGLVLVQIVLIDIVFSLDSVLTAVGMVRPDDYESRWVPLAIMVTAVLLAIAVMLIFSGPIANFVNRHPSIKMLALAFLILIGMVLVAESLHSHIPRGYVYFAMGFSLFVEALNLRARAGLKDQPTV